MQLPFRGRRIFVTLLWTTLALAAAETAAVVYYLNTWFTLPLL